MSVWDLCWKISRQDVILALLLEPVIIVRMNTIYSSALFAPGDISRSIWNIPCDPSYCHCPTHAAAHGLVSTIIFTSILLTVVPKPPDTIMHSTSCHNMLIQRAFSQPKLCRPVQLSLLALHQEPM